MRSNKIIVEVTKIRNVPKQMDLAWRDMVAVNVRVKTASKTKPENYSQEREKHL